MREHHDAPDEHLQPASRGLVTHGKGARLYDAQGREYLDALAGIAVNGLGHAHPKLVAALQEQLGRLIHTSNLYPVTEQEQLADRGGRWHATVSGARDLRRSVAPPTSDLYSVGVVLFHLLTGRYPIPGRTLAELTEAHRRDARTPLRHQFPDAPGGLAQIIEKALSPDVSRRHTHATSMAAALRQWLDEPSATQAATATRQATGWMAGLAVLVGAAVWSVGSARPPLPAQRAVVLVVPIQNQTGDPALDGAVDALLDRAISGSRHVSIAPASRIDDALTLMGNAAKATKWPSASSIRHRLPGSSGGMGSRAPENTQG